MHTKFLSRESCAVGTKQDHNKIRQNPTVAMIRHHHADGTAPALRNIVSGRTTTAGARGNSFPRARPAARVLVPHGGPGAV